MKKRAKAFTEGTFRSFRTRNYRLYFYGQLVSTSGTWMQAVALGWLVLRVTNSGFAVGVVTALQFLPMLLIGTYGGVIADRLDKRRTLIVTQSGRRSARPGSPSSRSTGMRSPVGHLPVDLRDRRVHRGRHAGAPGVRERDGRRGGPAQRGRP